MAPERAEFFHPRSLTERGLRFPVGRLVIKRNLRPSNTINLIKDNFGFSRRESGNAFCNRSRLR